jgi:hypothetical protein
VAVHTARPLTGVHVAKVTRLTPTMLSEELARLEREHGMSSSEFFHRYQEGQMGDSEDVMYWAGLCAMAMRRGVLTSPTIRA